MQFLTGLIKCAGLDPMLIGSLGGASIGAALGMKGMQNYVNPYRSQKDIETQRLLAILTGAAVGGAVGGVGGKSADILMSILRGKNKEDTNQEVPIEAILSKEDIEKLKSE